MVLDTILSAAFISALYAVIAIGFTLIFGVGGILNFAHGGFITLGAFSAYIASGYFGLPIFVGLLAGTLVGAAIGGATYLGVIRYVRTRPVTISTRSTSRSTLSSASVVSPTTCSSSPRRGCSSARCSTSSTTRGRGVPSSRSA
ncbi:hypothetical protein KY092_19380 [Natronomonas gomsonensis]|uniref:ABC transporter permease subunit n=1 Tax=Natronomonas gomsonensis TaxID=1046043 RepID=UPI0020CA5ADC|nr:hypothetical protein [Natronomonas gomsonensis]MCY4732703.1 hypothetical protein [Natronomonas gomsonensis]